MRRRLLPLLVGAGILGLAGPVWYWNRPTRTVELPGLSRSAGPDRGAAGPVRFLDQGWSPAEATDFYFHTQGSRLLPYDWFLALERPDGGGRFADPDHLDRFGYLTQRPSRANPDGLPVGFARDPRRPGEAADWLGFTCAACHTAEWRHGDMVYRIDGGPGGGDLPAFLAALTAALVATRDDPARFDRFAARAGGDRDALRKRLGEQAERRTRYEAVNRTPHPDGPARLDAFGRIVNQVLGEALGVDDPAQVRPPDAPVSYPFLWDTPHHDFVQWNGVARNKVFGSDKLGGLARNVGEVLGVFGEVRVSAPGTASTLTGYKSSARVPDLLHLEELVRKLRSPQWPGDFPPIDQAKRQAGAELFARYCVSCHADIDRADPNRAVTAVLTPVRRVGTDPRMAANFATRTGKAGRAEGRRLFFSAGDRLPPVARADDLLVHTVVGVILGSPWKNYQDAGLAGLRAGDGPAAAGDDPLMVYKARPLNGVWATAPFLHNGSVPTLYDLLLPTEERLAEFPVGSRRFDPVKVGLDTAPGVGGFRFRTRGDNGQPIPGNSNAGHEYGTGRPRAAGGDGLPALTDEERWQLVEYLKSL